MERVMDEFEVTGEIVRIQSLHLDLGSIEDADFETLFPLMLEQALRDELGQMMIRRQYDPLVEVETLSYSQGALEDWLYYLQHGIRRWHDNAKAVSITEILKHLSTTEVAELRSRLVTLVGKNAVMERMLGQLEAEDLPELIKLLFGENRNDLERWIVQIVEQAVTQLSTKKTTSAAVSAAIKKIITQNLIKHWGRYGFEPNSKEQAKVKTLATLQEELKVAIQSPLPEMGEQVAESGDWSNAKVLQYLLFYGYWAAGATKPEAEVDLGEYIIQLLQSYPLEIRNVLRETLAYATARKRMVYQLRQEQLKKVVESAFPQMHQSLVFWQQWIKAMPITVQAQLQTPHLIRNQLLELLEIEGGTTQPTAQQYQERLAVWTAAQLPETVMEEVAKLVNAPMGVGSPAVIGEIKAFSNQVIQAFREAERLGLLNSSLSNLRPDNVEMNGVEANDTNIDSRRNHPKPIIPKSLFKDIPEEYKQNQQEMSSAYSNTDEESEPTAQVPKNQLEALLYFLRFGVWPETLDATASNFVPDGEMDMQPGIFIPEAILSQLLKDKPLEVLAGLFPMLVSVRVRERLVYQLSDAVFHEVIAAFSSMHPPTARFESYYQQLQPLMLQFQSVASLPNVATALKTFILTLLYEEPKVRNAQAFTTQFLQYWQGLSEVGEVEFTKTVTEAIKSQAVLPIALSQLLTASLDEIEQASKAIATTGRNTSTDAENTSKESDLLIAALLQEGREDELDATPNDTLSNTSQSVNSEFIESDNIEENLFLKQIREAERAASAQEADPVSDAKNKDLELGKNTQGTESHRGSSASSESERLADPPNQLKDIGKAAEENEIAPKPQAESIGADKSEVDQNYLDSNDPESKLESAKGSLKELETSKELTSLTEKNISADKDKTEVGDNSADAGKLKESPTPETITPKVNSSKANEDSISTSLTDDHAEIINDEVIQEVNATEDYRISLSATLPFNDSQTVMEHEDATEQDLPEIEQKTLRQKIERINRQKMPEKVKQKKLVRPQDPFTREEPMAPLEEPVFIDNAGLVLVWPFIGRCFSALGYTEKGLFKDMGMANRAIHLLQYMVTGEEQAPEHELVLNKILCGIPVFEAVERDVILTAQERDEADHMLKAAVQNWEKMNKLSVAAFRDSFLKRSGRLVENDVSWTLRVDQVSYDMLLDTLPWTIGMIKLRYMEKVLYVEWR